MHQPSVMCSIALIMRRLCRRKGGKRGGKRGVLVDPYHFPASYVGERTDDEVAQSPKRKEKKGGGVPTITCGFYSTYGGGKKREKRRRPNGNHLFSSTMSGKKSKGREGRELTLHHQHFTP